MAKAPAFQFYANDFMDATSTWEANACGLYVRCLCKQWTLGSIPADLKILARAIHCDRSELEQCWPTIGPKFEDQGDGTLKNRRLEDVRTRQMEVSSKRSNAGKAGAIAKANAKANGSTKTQQRKVKEKVEGEEVEESVSNARKVLFSNSVYSDVSKATNELPELVLKGANIAALRDSIRNWSDAKDERRTNRGWLATYRTFFERDRAMPMRTRPDQTGQRETLKTEWV